MASRLTILCSDADEAATLFALLKDRLAKGDGGGAYKMAVNGRAVEACEADGRPADDPVPRTDRHSRELCQAAAEAVAALIVGHLEPRLISRMIAGRVVDMEAEELEEVKGICFRMLNGSADGGSQEGAPRAMRQAGIVRKAAACLREHPCLDVNGFFRFRLPEYRSDLNELVDLALEEYAADRQYREFIALLKYFVYFQDAKIPRANLIHCGDNRYVVLDHRMEPLEWCGSEEVVVEQVDRELNYEDMIVSTLISASPGHVVIHTREPDTPSIRTIKQIFEGRTTLCTCCNKCEPLLDREEEASLT